MRPAYSPAAEQGQAGVQFNLGVMYDMSTAIEPQPLSTGPTPLDLVRGRLLHPNHCAAYVARAWDVGRRDLDSLNVLHGIKVIKVLHRYSVLASDVEYKQACDLARATGQPIKFPGTPGRQAQGQSVT